jgi:hypothetical protein
LLIPFLRSMPVTAATANGDPDTPMPSLRRRTAIQLGLADNPAEPAGGWAGAVEGMAAVDESRGPALTG